MPYTTYEELVITYPVLKTWAIDESEVSSGLIYDSEIEINGRFASKFTVPFSPVPPTINVLTKDMAYSKALWRFDTDKAESFQKYVDDRITAIMSGTISIFTGSGSVLKGGAASTIWSNTMDYQPVFSMLDAENVVSQVSSERLYDEENARD